MQTLVTIGLVVLATAYVGRAMVRTVFGGSCATGCGKCAAPVVVTPESKRRIALPQV